MFIQFSKRLRILESYSVWIEIVSWSSAFIVFGYLFKPADPLFLNSDYDILLIYMTIFTLFYGTVVGLSIFSIIYLAALNFYDLIPYVKVMEYLIFILVFGEFHYHWNRRINISEENTKYANNRLRMLGNAFFLTKISHDQLEKGYVLKPVTLRGAIVSLINDHTQEERYAKFSHYLEHYFSLDSAAYFHIDDSTKSDKKFEIGKGAIEFDRDNPMVEKMLNTQQAVYVSDEHVHQSEILVVIPSFDYNGKLKGSLIIKEIPFMMFNLDNILKIEVILNYFEQENRIEEINFPFQKIPNGLNRGFLFELSRLKNLKERYGIESSLLLIHTTEGSVESSLDHFILNNLRVLDITDKVCYGTNHYVYLFFFPLESISGVLSFQERLFSSILPGLKSKMDTLILEIDKLDNGFMWMEELERASH